MTDLKPIRHRRTQKKSFPLSWKISESRNKASQTKLNIEAPISNINIASKHKKEGESPFF